MKTKIAILAIGALALVSCSDLDMGVSVSSAGASPYIYGSTGPLYTGPYFGPDFPYGYNPGPLVSNPPLTGNGPGSVFNPAPSRPKPVVNVNPGINGPSNPNPNPGNNPSGGNNPGFNIGGVPGAGSGMRPGNGGLPSGQPVTNNPASVPTGQPVP